MTAPGLCRLAFLKSPAVLNINNDSKDDEFLQMILVASDFVRMYCNRDFDLRQYIERYTGDDTNKLYPRETPINEIQKVEFWDGSEWDEETSTNYTLIRSRMILYPSLEYSGALYSSWISTYPEGIRITYTAGYEAEKWNSADDVTGSWGVPHDLELAVAHITALNWKDSATGGGRLGLSSMALGSDSISTTKYLKEFPNFVKRTLDQYKRLSI